MILYHKNNKTTVGYLKIIHHILEILHFMRFYINPTLQQLKIHIRKILKIKI